MKILNLLFIIMSFSFSAYAQRTKVVLLTSLFIPEKAPVFYLNNLYINYIDRIEKKFRGHFEKSNYQIEVIHNANQYNLYHTLEDESVEGVFWLSHSSKDTSNETIGVSMPSRLLDYDLFDVAPILQNYHPNLKWLSIIGCHSKKILDQLNVNNKNGPVTFVFDKRIDAYRGLKKSLKASQLILNSNSIQKSNIESGVKKKAYSISVTRKVFKNSVNELAPSLRIVMGGQLIGVFDEISEIGYTTQSAILDVSIEQNEKMNDRKIILDTGLNPSGCLFYPKGIRDKNKRVRRSKNENSRELKCRSINIGDISISGSTSDKNWDRFEDAEGNPIGIGYHLFR